MVNNKIESGRAEFALSKVREIIDDKGVNHKEYKSYCRKFPSMVQTNGLAAAIAFIREKKGTYLKLYDNIQEWLKKCEYCPKDEELIDYICGLETSQYRIVVKETLALFNWMRRFASGLIEGDD